VEVQTPQNQSRRSDGTLQGPREKLPWPADKPFRILSIDGGGIRGILPASILARFEETLLGGRSAGDYFDMIAGTSTGGIIALALSLGTPASDILKLYVDHGATIFPEPRGPLKWFRRKLRDIRAVHRHRYKREPLEERLHEIFGERLLGEAQRRLCIPSFDGFTEVHIFKTPHHPDFKLDWKERMTTVASATSAAPTFFAVYRDGDRRFADGGVWANNPVMIALVDALACYDLDRRQVEILSLGCGESEMFITTAQTMLGGLWDWKKIISAAMRLAGQNALGQAGLLIGRDHLMRLDVPLDKDYPIALDDYRRAKAELLPAGIALADEALADAQQRFFYEPAKPYEAYAGPRAAASKSE
jgi:patatin-like phospholipase/acyl hydrolase